LRDIQRTRRSRFTGAQSVLTVSSVVNPELYDSPTADGSPVLAGSFVSLLFSFLMRSKISSR